MHSHDKHATTVVRDDGSYVTYCTKCDKVLKSRPPVIDQRKEMYDGD